MASPSDLLLLCPSVSQSLSSSKILQEHKWGGLGFPVDTLLRACFITVLECSEVPLMRRAEAALPQPLVIGSEVCPCPSHRLC